MDIILLIMLIAMTSLLWAAINGSFAKAFYGLVQLIWLIPLGISMANPFGLYAVSLDVYIIVIVGILSFNIGYLTLNNSSKIHLRISIINEINSISNIRLIRIIFLTCLVLLCSLALTQWRLISFQGGMGNLKLEFFELIFNSNSGLFFLYQAIIIPLFFISCMLFTYMTISSVFSKKSLLLFVYIFIFSYVGGKRGYFSIFLQYFLIAYVAKRFAKSTINHYIKTKTWITIFSLGILAFSGAAYMTSVGSSGSYFEKNDFTEAAIQNAENTIVYQIGPYRALDYALQNDYIEKYGGYTWGRATLGGMIDYYGCGILNMLDIPVQRARDLSMNPLQNNSIPVGENRTWNFSYTSFYYFIFDLGWIGVFLFSFLFGIFVRYSVNLYNNIATIGSLCLMGYLFIGCVLFNATWFNISLYTLPTILICIILSQFELKIRKKHHKHFIK